MADSGTPGTASGAAGGDRPDKGRWSRRRKTEVGVRGPDTHDRTRTTETPDRGWANDAIPNDRGRNEADIASSPSFIRQAEGNGCPRVGTGRFIRTLKERFPGLRISDTVEKLHRALREFAQRFNRHGMFGRIGYRTPARDRRELLGKTA